MTAVAVSGGAGRCRPTSVTGVDRSLATKSATGSNGSASAGRPRELTAGKLTPKVSHRIADTRGRQWTTHTCPSAFSKAARCSALASQASLLRSGRSWPPAVGQNRSLK